jgi:hypothetical protein
MKIYSINQEEVLIASFRFYAQIWTDWAYFVFLSYKEYGHEKIHEIDGLTNSGFFEKGKAEQNRILFIVNYNPVRFGRCCDWRELN